MLEEKKEIKQLKRKLRKQEKKNVEIRDQMAIQRTIFANERTLMAYMRTAIALIAGGFAAVKLSQHDYMALMGLLLMPAGLALAIYSFVRYLQKQKLIKRHSQDYTHTSQHHNTWHENEVPGSGKAD